MAAAKKRGLARVWLGLLAGAALLAGVVSLATGAPQHTRLSYTGNTATTMTVSWNTSTNTGSEVQYGTSPGNYTWTETGTEFQATGALGWVHEVTLTGLQPSTTYYYIAGSAADGYSAEFNFTTGPVEDPNCAIFKFVFLGDNRPDATLGGGENWPEILGQAWAHLPVFVLNGGDLVIEGDNIGQWVDFLSDTTNVAAYVPFLPCIGNHDNGPGEGDGANYNQIFALPRSTGTYGSNTEDYYYFTYGNAIFVALSTETYKGGGIPFETQADYLDEALTQNPRKWKFVYYHKPSYTHEVFFSISHEPNEESQNAALIPVIDAHHVDVVFTSHNHWYERFEPTACANQGNAGSNDPCSVGANNFANGTVFIVSGGAGAFTIPGFLCGSLSGRAFCSGDHNYTVVTIQNETLTMETWAAYPQSNQVIDGITIVKPASACGTLPDGGVVPDGGVTPDGGTGQDGGGGDGDGGGGDGDGGTGQDGGPRPDASSGAASDSGCNCRSANSQKPVSLPLFLLVFGLVSLLCARRRFG